MTENIGQHIARGGMGVFDDELQWLYDTGSTMESIVEIGSFHGRSTYALLKSCKGVVYSIDNNYDQGKSILRDNLKDFSNVVFHVIDSVEASKKFEDRSIDMVFIDGDHRYPKVRQDIEAWLPKAKKIICGHDYIDEHPLVVKAVKEVFGVNFTLHHTIWVVRREI